MKIAITQRAGAWMRAALCMLVATAAFAAHAQTYPAKPIRIISSPPLGSSGGVTVPVTDLANDRIQLFFPSYTSLLPVIKSGRVKVLAIVDRNRLKVLPDVPTIFESVPNYTLLPSFFGLLAPAGIPAPIAGRFQAELRKALQDPEVNAKLDALGSTPVGNSPEKFGEEIRAMIDTYGRVVKAVGIESQ
ncbi:MAG: hypothetical protein EXR28_05640 [Betaproteobacteria bacterium]|nr:hypothetical protein [Betaproteobacteria bacterium]